MDYSMLMDMGTVNRSFMTFMSDTLKGTNLRFAEAVLLLCVGDEESRSQESISIQLNIDRAAVARGMKYLEENGYITRKTSKRDRRAMELYLTDKGKETYTRIQTLCSIRLSQYFMGVKDKDRDRFLEVLEKVTENSRIIN